MDSVVDKPIDASDIMDRYTLDAIGRGGFGKHRIQKKKGGGKGKKRENSGG